MGRDLKVIDRHLRHWRDRGLVEADVERRLRESSEELERSGAVSVLRTALALLGGALVLAGLVLIIAENWMALHRGLKLVGWAALLVVFLVASQALAKRFPERLALSEAVALIAGGWVLAGIALVSQIYHLDARTPNGVWMWLILVLSGAWLLPRRAMAAVLFVATVAALALEVREADSLVHARHAETPWLWLAIPLLAATLVARLPRALPELRSWVGFWIFAAGQTFLLVLGATQDLHHSELGAAWLLVAAGMAAALAWPGRVFPDAWDATTSRLIVALTVLPWVLLGGGYESGVLLDGVGIGAAWVVQLAVAILVVRAGAQVGSHTWINFGYVALLVGVVVRYFDFFGDFLEGGAALALTGFVLLFVLFALEKARRRTMALEAVS